MADIKKALVCGAGGFIGSHMVRRLRSEGYWVRGVDQSIQSLVRQKLMILLKEI